MEKLGQGVQPADSPPNERQVKVSKAQTYETAAGNRSETSVSAQDQDMVHQDHLPMLHALSGQGALASLDTADKCAHMHSSAVRIAMSAAATAGESERGKETTSDASAKGLTLLTTDASDAVAAAATTQESTCADTSARALASPDTIAGGGGGEGYGLSSGATGPAVGQNTGLSLDVPMPVSCAPVLMNATLGVGGKIGAVCSGSCSGSCSGPCCLDDPSELDTWELSTRHGLAMHESAPEAPCHPSPPRTTTSGQDVVTPAAKQEVRISQYHKYFG